MVVYLSHDLSHICHALGGFQGSTEKAIATGSWDFLLSSQISASVKRFPPTSARDPAKEEPSSETFSYVNFSNLNFSNVNFSNVLDVG